MSKIKTLQLQLLDGNLEGRLKCSFANWAGTIYKIPRNDFGNCKNITLLQQNGIYILLGKDKSERNATFIGQADIRKDGKGLLLRVYERCSTLDFWTEAVMITTEADSLSSTDIDYLESFFTRNALDAESYDVKSICLPFIGTIPSSIQPSLNDFTEYVKIAMKILGYDIFTPLKTGTPPLKPDELMLFMKHGTSSATAKMIGNDIYVLKGSTLSLKLTPSCPDKVKNERQKYAAYIDRNNILTADLRFTSPSAASSFVCGASSNGKTVWKDKKGRCLSDILDE